MEPVVRRAGAADLSERAARWWVAAIAAALAACLVTIVLWRYAIFRDDVDLGIFSQVIGSVGRGFSSTPEGGVSHLLVHWSPTIVLAWPFLRALGPAGLQIAQALLVSATIVPLWGLARARFSAPVAVLATAAGALYPILWANGVGDFHEMAFVPLLSTTLVYALDRRRWRLGYAAALLLLCTKEDQFVILACNGALCALAWRRDAEARRFGLTLAGLAAAMAALYFGVVRNVVQPHLHYGAVGFFDWSAVPPSSLGLGTLLVPRIEYVAAILVPLALLPCFSRYGLFLIPGFVETLASRQPVTIAPGAHYSALLSGYALAAFADGASRVGARLKGLRLAPIAAAAALSIAIGIWASPMEYWYYLYRLPNAHDALLERTLATLPKDAAVGAEDEIYSHLATNPNASITFAGQEWFVYDQTHYSQRWRSIDEPAVRRALATGTYAVVSSEDGIVVLHRKHGA